MIWRPRFSRRFTLRAVWVLVTLLAIPLGVISACLRHNTQVLKHVAAIEAASDGANLNVINYPWGPDAGYRSHVLTSWKRINLVRVLRCREPESIAGAAPYFAAVGLLDCRDCQLNDEIFTTVLAQSPTVSLVAVHDNPLTDACIPALAASPKLGALLAVNVAFSDAGIERLLALEKLSSLQISLPDGVAESVTIGKGSEKLIDLEIHSGSNGRVPAFKTTLPKLKIFAIHGPLNDENLITLASQAPQLQHVSLLNSDVTAAGIRSLRTHRLHVLDLAGTTTIDDDALAEIAKFPSLPPLMLSRTSVTSAGLKHLAGTNVTSLTLCGTSIDDEGLKHLAQCPQLTTLDLSDTAITSAGVSYLEATNISNLTLDDTQVDDEVLASLMKMKSLGAWSCHRTAVSSDAQTQHLEFKTNKDWSGDGVIYGHEPEPAPDEAAQESQE